jgi:hypothetical protein
MSAKKMSLIAAIAIAVAAPAIASADHDRFDGRRVQLAEVGTHRHDAEDYVNVNPRMRLDGLQLRASDGVVAIDGVRIRFADGRDIYAPVQRRLRAGESVTVDLPPGPIKQFIVDYGNHGPYWRARETAHLQVIGLTGDRFDDRSRFGDRGRYRDQVRVRAPYTTHSTAPSYQYEVRGGLQFKL